MTTDSSSSLAAAAADSGGPPVTPVEADGPGDPRARSRRRIMGGVLAIPTGGLLGVAAWLTPSGGGTGTHMQLGLPDCGWMVRLDLPCPTCGMTTAFAHSAEGNLIAAFATQPFGALLAVITAATLVGALWTAASGTAVFGLMISRWVTPRVGWIGGGLLLLAWGYKIATHRGWI